MAVETRPGTEPRTENAPNPEAVFNQTFAALHPLLLKLPNPNLGRVTRDGLGNFADRDYSLFESRSRAIRRERWAGRGDFQAQMAVWLPDTIQKFQNSKQFFTDSPRGQHWSKVLGRLGINAQDFKSEDAMHLYQTYLSGSARDQKSKKFVEDMKSVDDFSLADLEAIAWIGGMFGTQLDQTKIQQEAGPDEVIAHHVYAEQRCEKNPDDMVSQANVKVTIPDGQEKLRSEVLHPSEARVFRFYQQPQVDNQTDVADQSNTVPAPADARPNQNPAVPTVGLNRPDADAAITVDPNSTPDTTPNTPVTTTTTIRPATTPTAVIGVQVTPAVASPRPVEAARPNVQAAFITPEQIQNHPEGLVGLVNERLEQFTSAEAVLQAEPQTLADFFKTLELENVNRIDSATARFENGKLVLQTKLEATKGSGILKQTVNPNIQIVIESDPQTGQLRVLENKTQIIDVNPIQRLFVQGTLDKYIKNLNRVITEQINKQIDRQKNPNWQSQGVQIAGDKLDFRFQKRAA